METEIKRGDLKYKTKNYTYGFQQYETITYFAESIYTVETEDDKSNLLEYFVKFNNKYRPKNKEVKDKKRDTYDSVYALYDSRELTLNAFKSEIFSIKTSKDKVHYSVLARLGRLAKCSDRKVFDSIRLKILATNQMLQRLPITLVQVKAGNIYENLLNEIKQILYSMYHAKEVTKNNITV